VQCQFIFIREKVRIGKPDATDDEIDTAAWTANIHTFIVGPAAWSCSIAGRWSPAGATPTCSRPLGPYAQLIAAQRHHV
jgi:hypothetical protein